jgi:hypothetical protein
MIRGQLQDWTEAFEDVAAMKFTTCRRNDSESVCKVAARLYNVKTCVYVHYKYCIIDSLNITGR